MPPTEKIPNNLTPVPGWKGGFSASNPAFAYPDPNLTSLPLLCNMDNVPKLKRQVHVLWPEFSWEVERGVKETRCYETFAPDISRLGYDVAGRVWSIICPQQGAASPTFGSLNIEVTVTGQRGWIDESVPDPYKDLLAADMNVTGKVWFAPGAKDRLLYRILEDYFNERGLPFPMNKSNAIEVTLHNAKNPADPTIAVRSGICPDFDNPPFALHYQAQPNDPDSGPAWGVANVQVQIGPVLTSNDELVDEFNQLVMDAFNVASGNILQEGNVLTWNVWFDAPTLVDQVEWANHAKYWRESIDVDNVYPDGPPTKARYFDGRPFEILPALIHEEIDKIEAWLRKHGVPVPGVVLADLRSMYPVSGTN